MYTRKMATRRFILGISLGFNASACLINAENGESLGAISEERLTGERNTKSVPLQSIAFLADKLHSMVGEDKVKIDVAYAHYEDLTNEFIEKYTRTTVAQNAVVDECLCKDWPTQTLFKMVHRAVASFIADKNFEITGIRRVDHHTAHAYSPFFVYAWPTAMNPQGKALVITSDGFGDGYSTVVWRCEGNTLKEMYKRILIESPALLYQFVTGALGFKEHQHEGKVTGLATAFMSEMKDDPVYIEVKKKMHAGLTHGNESHFIDSNKLLEYTEEQHALVADSPIKYFSDFLRLKNTVYSLCKEILPEGYDVSKITECKEALALCVWVQDYMEWWFKNLISECVPFSNDYDVYLAGGAFANVAVNRLFSMRFKNVYITPCMGDEGTAVGAAIYAFLHGNNSYSFQTLRQFRPDNIISAGSPLEEFDDDMLSMYIGNLTGVEITHYDNDIEYIKVIADKLKNGEIVHLCIDENEFGPRALMHRSTLFQATEPRLNMILNTAMQRNEFMPYAPVVHIKNMQELFYSEWRYVEQSCHFMTIALQAQQKTREQYPGAIHKDGTCRLQIVDPNHRCELLAAKILEAYEELTGNKMLINTSFNLHNNPTANTIHQCLDTWIKSGYVGTLVLNNVMLCKEKADA